MKKDKRNAVLFSGIIILLLIQAAQAGDWPMLGHDAEHSGTADEVIEPPLELMWKYDIGYYVGSSPAVSSGLMYVGSGDGYVYALDAYTGSLKWKYKAGWGVSSSPALSGGVVYVGSWDSDYTQAGYVYALDAYTGSLKWKYKTGGAVGNSPAVSGDVVYVGSGDGYVYALDANTGSLKWKYGHSDCVCSSPTVSHGVVYVGSRNWGSTEAGYVYALDANTGSLKWKYKTSGGDSSPAVSSGIVYVGSNDGYMYALDANTGSLKWKYGTGKRVGSSPAVSDGVVYVGSDDGYMYALDANTGSLKWKYGTGKRVDSSSAVSGGVVYVGSDEGYMYALDANTGSLKWKYNTGSSLSYSPEVSSPAVSGGVVYVGSTDGTVYAFAPQPYVDKHASTKISEATVITKQEMAKGFDVSSAEQILTLAEDAMYNKNYSGALQLAAQAKILSLDIDSDGVPNSEDFIPSINNYYIYSGASIFLMCSAVTLRWDGKRKERHRLERQSLDDEQHRKQEATRRRLEGMKQEILDMIDKIIKEER